MNVPEWIRTLDSAGFTVMSTALSILWQSSLLLGVIGFLSYLLRRRKASVRFSLWVSALLVIAFLPLLTAALAKIGTPQRELSVIPSYSTPAVEVAHPPVQPQAAMEEKYHNVIQDEKQSETRNTDSQVIPRYGLPSDTVDEAAAMTFLTAIPRYPWAFAFMVYCAGAIFFLAWILIGRLRIRGWILNGDAVMDRRVVGVFQQTGERLGLKREIVLIENSNIPAPLTCRIFRPVIILPKGFTGNLTAIELQAIAVHELSHVKRNDVVVFAILSFIKALLFFHPLVWYAVRQVSYLAELSCDSCVVEYTDETVSYAELLTRIAELLPNRSLTTELAAGIVFSKSMFFRRIQAILSNRKRIQKLSRLAVAGIAVMVFLSIAITFALPLGEKKPVAGNSVRVSGRVIHNGKPVSGASIYLVDPENLNYELYTVDKVASTRGDGSFSFSCDDHHLMRPFFQSLVVAGHPDHAVGGIALSRTLDVGNLTITLGKAATIEGRVIDSEGKPLEGAIVTVRTILNLSKGFTYYETSAIPELTGKTDRNGRYAIGNIPVGANPGLDVTCKGHAKTNRREILAGQKDVDFTLETEGCIKGRVVYDDTGKPARDVRVFADCIEFRKPNSDIVKTDRHGYFTISNLAKGVYHVTLPPDDAFPQWTAKAAENISVESGATVDGIELRLIQGGIVTGMVTDADTGQPLSGVTVTATPERINSGLILDKTVTDKKGVYRLRIVPGRFGLYAYPPTGYFTLKIPVQNEVEEGDTIVGCDFTFTKGITVNGMVFSPGSEPLAGVEIVGRRYSGWRGKVISDDRGGFVITGLKDGEMLQVEAFLHEQRLQTWADFEIHDGMDIEIHLERYETATVEGRLVDEHGDPISGAKVELEKSEKAPDGHGFSSLSTIVAMTDDTGHFQTPDLIIGKNQGYLSVYKPGYKLSGIIANMDTITTGKTLLENIVLASEIPPDRWLEGKIVNTDGAPVVGAHVYFTTGYYPSKETYSNADGRFRLDGLKREIEMEFSVQHSSYGWYSFEYLPSNQFHTFVLHPVSGSISGTVVDIDEKPIQGVVLIISENNIGPTGIINFTNKTDEHGKFTLTNLIDESYTITAYSREHGYKKLENVKVNTRDLHITLSKDSTFTPSSDRAAFIEYRKATRDRRKNLLNSPAPELDVGHWLTGEPLKLANLTGKVILLYFWDIDSYTTVRPYVILDHWQKKYGRNGVVVIAVQSYTTNEKAIRDFIKEKNIGYHVCIDRETDITGAGGVTCDAYTVGAVGEIPCCIIIDRKGTIVCRTESLLGGTQIDIREIEDKIVELIGD